MLNVTKHSKTVLVEMPEKVVFCNAESMKFELQSLINEGHTNLTLDLRNVTFVDSSGLAVFVSAYKTAQHQNGRVCLLSPNNNVRMLIELTRLHQIFPIYDDIHALRGTLDS